MRRRVAVIGAGIGGLAAALDLARQGHDVTVLERAAAPGGKMRQVAVGTARIDAGPTVFTMRWVFEELFADAGALLADHITLHPASVLARHAWGDAQLDLFADVEQSTAAIGAFAGAAEARGFAAFCAEARRIYRTLEGPFIRSPRPNAVSLAMAAGFGEMWRIKPFETMWAALSQHFADPRLRQLFGRYATYCGSSPYRAPATLMLVAHVEQDGVWLVEGGMHQVALALAKLAAAQGATIRYGAEVAEVLTGSGRASGVRLASGERVEADAVVLNADPAALAAGLFGRAAAGCVPATPVADRSLSAVTWAMVAEADGFPLLHHTVFFSDDYAAEFQDLQAGRLPAKPTAYLCAQDRDSRGNRSGTGPERLLCLVNAPALGDVLDLSPQEIDRCADRTFGLLARSGLRLATMDTPVVTTPREFGAMFPGTGGALYGPAVHGAMASFRRPGSRTKLPGLFLAGGATHPGAGVPMAALSGRLAASAVTVDLGSTATSRRTAMRGGMSTR